MKRVKIYRPKVKEVQKGKSMVRVIEDKKATLIGEKAVMDKTLDLFQNATDEYIINAGLYIEEDKSYKPKRGPKIEVDKEPKIKEKPKGKSEIKEKEVPEPKSENQ